MGKTEDEILRLLKENPLSLMEISDELQKKPKAVFRSLRKLFEKGKIISDPETRRYMLAKEE